METKIGQIWENKMILGILLSCLLHVTISGVLGQKWDTKLGAPLSPEPEVCLTGHMTDVQKWVDENGVLTKWTDPLTSVDLSSTKDAVTLLTKEVQGAFKSSRVLLQYLSLANCGLGRVPTVFQLRDRMGRTLSDTLQYVSLYGNNFADVSAPGEQYDMTMNATWATELPVDYRLKHRGGDPIWTVGFQRVTLTRLRELDLRKCSIQILSDNLFSGMPELQALYLGENNINLVSTYAFDGLFNLQHLDISSNIAREERNLVFDSTDVLRNLTRLSSLDFSFTKILQSNVGVLVNLGPRLQRLSLCHTGLRLPANAFRTTSMRYLDLSGNSGILGVKNVLSGIEKSLQVLYANNVVLRNLDLFYRFRALEILKLKSNELSYMESSRITYSLQNLQILDLDKNRIATWLGNVFGGMGKLKYLSLRDNNINLISEDVIADIRNISYVALSGNNPVCNCHARDLFETALKNDNATQIILQSTAQPSKNPYDFHNGFSKINQIIANRTPIKKACGKMCPEIEFETDGKFVLIDYDPETYLCLMLAEGKILSFNSVPSCLESRRESDYYEDMWGRWRGLLSLLVIPIVLFPLMIFAYRYRRNFKYFVITMKNSATLSLINNKEGVYDETAIYNYDVFVSYCDEDRDWVLDYLLPHLEKDCNVSVCLHERDFQVGLSILENIVSCMDRSRSIMLILSKRFLLSQWCQFEMHLAQHRLLETRREDLTLVLLEDIPRRLRPTILHYLMLTKTYIVWPKVVSEQAIFWKRLKKSITTYRLNENVSLA